MSNTRAKVGGEYGVNGEWYNGGQFLPSSAQTVKGEFKNTAKGKAQKPRKQEVEPYVWKVAPTADSQSIYTFLAGRFAIGRATLEFCASDQTLAYFRTSKTEVKELIDRYNRGERWMTK